MVDIPYHTHTFDIPTASEGEIRAGLEAGKAITPDRLFPVLADKADKATTLAGYGITDAATKEQGLKADSAVQPSDLGALAKKDTITTADISASGSADNDAILTRGGTWVKPTGVGDMLESTWKPVIDANTASRHTHANKAILDATTASYLASEKAKLAGIPADADKTPALAAVATTGSYNDLANKPDIPPAQVQSDWNAANGVSAIKNKPALGTAAAKNAEAFATADQGNKADKAVRYDEPQGLSAPQQGQARSNIGAVSTTDIDSIFEILLGMMESKSSYNWIINGDFTINQRGGVKKPANGVYGFDRWKGHANGIEQIVEALPAGEYTLTWSGGGTGTFGGQTKSSPIKVTVGGGNTSVIVPETATKVSLVAGDATAADPWVNVARSVALEMDMCQRYYQLCHVGMSFPGIVKNNWYGSIQNYRTVPRAMPSVYLKEIISSFNCETPFIERSTLYGSQFTAKTQGAADFHFSAIFVVESEL